MPTALVEAVESEDTPQSYAYAFLAASGIPDADLSVLFDHIEDIVAQADETPSTLYVSTIREGGRVQSSSPWQLCICSLMGVLKLLQM